MSRGSRSRLGRASMVLGAAIATAPSPAIAGEPQETGSEAAIVGAPTIVIVGDAADPFGAQLVAELGALGFEARVLPPDAAVASRASLEAAARRAGAIAAVRAVPSERGVEVWIADRITGKTVLREMQAQAAGRDASLALRVVELLRASLIEITIPSAPRGEIPAPPRVRERLVPAPVVTAPEPPPAPPSTLRFSLAPAALLSPGGVRAAASLDLGLAWMPSEHVGLSAFTAIPLTAARAEASAGGVDLRAWLAGAAVRFHFASRASRWAPVADVGVTAVILQSAGAATDGSKANAETKAAPAPFARLGVGFAITPSFRLHADALFGVVVQGVSIEFAHEEIAKWGRPFALLGGGVDFGWF